MVDKPTRNLPPKRKVRIHFGVFPTTRLGWHQFYVREYNRRPRTDAAVLAMWYHFLHLAYD